MLNWLVQLAIRRRGVVIALAALLAGFAIYDLRHPKLDVFPDFVPPQCVIQTEAPGFSPEQVEMLVTRPVESTLSGLPAVEAVRSQSIPGLSIVTVVFKDDANVLTARQLVAEQLAVAAASIPAGVQPPKLTPLTSATMDLLKIGLTSETKSPMELRAFADWTLKPRLQAVPGVASVGVMGGETRQIQIQVDPDKLRILELDLNTVLEAARGATGVRGAGFIESENQRILLQSEGRAVTPAQIGACVVTRRSGTVIRLADVAVVTAAPAPKYGDALIQGKPGVLVKLLSQFGANTMDATRAAEAALEELRPVFAAEQIEVSPRLHRPATFIETALGHVGQSLLLGGALVVLVLLVFLLNLRTALISIVAIPLSLLCATLLLQRFGYSLNTITLGGLAIAIGEVVDDAIIDVENILRRLRQNRQSEEPRPVWRVVLEASLEVRSAVVYATFVVVLVFVPVLTLSGLQGRMFAPLAVAYILAILASLMVALTVTPALCCLLLPATAESHEPAWLRGLRRFYQALLGGLIRFAGRGAFAGIVLVAGAAALCFRFGNEFLPEFREGHFVAQVSSVPGTSLTEMMRLGSRISDALCRKVQANGQPVIDTVEMQAGRAELGEDPWGPHRCEFHIELKPDMPGAVQAAAQQQIRDVLAGYPGVSSEVVTFLGDRISETVTGETAEIVVNIFGTDLDALDRTTRRIQGLISGVPGTTDVRMVSPPGTPFLTARLRPEQVAFYGLRPLDVMSMIETAYQGTRVGQVFEADRTYDVAVILANSKRTDPESLADLLLRTPDGRDVPLGELADMEPSSGRYMVMHDGARRRQAITCNSAQRDLQSVVADIHAKLDHLDLPSGTYLEIGGEEEARGEAQAELLWHSGLAGVGVCLLLAMVFRRSRNLLLVLLNLPLAFVGGVLAVWLTGGTLSIGSLVGFVTLFGVTMRNSMMLVSHFEHLVQVEGCEWGPAAAIRAAGERLAPILMTALVTGLGLLPIALGAGEVGREIEGPMAIVIFGGLVTSTALNLLLLPALAARFGKFEQRVEV